MDPEEERVMVMSVMSDRLLETEKTLFLIQQNWWDNWMSYTYRKSPRPGSMNNSQLMFGFDIVKPQKFILVHPQAYEILSNIYDSKPDVELFIIDKVPDFSPANLYIDTPGGSKSNMLLISLKITVGELKAYVLKKRSLQDRNYSVYMNNITLCESDVLANAGVKANSKLEIRGEWSTEAKVDPEDFFGTAAAGEYEEQRENEGRRNGMRINIVREDEQRVGVSEEEAVKMIRTAAEGGGIVVSFKEVEEIERFIDSEIERLNGGNDI